MTKIRVLIFFLTIAVVAVGGVLASLYARGYRFDRNKLAFKPNGLLVVNSDPGGAQVFINGELTTATNATVTVSPGDYDVEVKKEGYLPWSKRVSVNKEVVTELSVSLFLQAPSLSALTFSGAIGPVVSEDQSKVAYLVPFSRENQDKAGLWILETVSLPLGFNRDPRRITDGDLRGATWEFSPDSREVLVTTKTSAFTLDTAKFTPQNERVNVASSLTTIKKGWEEEEKKRLLAKLAKLENPIEDIFIRKAAKVRFSPDENKILYEASASAVIPTGIVKTLPGASTQKETRELKSGGIYLYDVKEDKNFLLSEETKNFLWLPTSDHLVSPEKDGVFIVDYDGTNRQRVYQGAYEFPHSYPYTNSSRLVILTNLGAGEVTPNLYSLNVK